MTFDVVYFIYDCIFNKIDEYILLLLINFIIDVCDYRFEDDEAKTQQNA